MPDSKEIIIEIKTSMSESIDTLVKLQKELDNVRVEQMKVEAAFKSGSKTREEADKELQVLAATQRSLSADMKSVKKEIDNQTKAFKENEGSIQKMRAELANMRKEYESLSKSDREGDKGQKLLENISKTTDELKQLEAAQGDYRREVGHYQNAIAGLSPTLSKALGVFRSLSMGTMSLGTALKNGIKVVKAFSVQMLKLLANPFVAAFTAIVVVVMKLVDAFKKNDAAMTALQRAFAAFKPILDLVNKGFNAIVDVLTKAVNGIANFVNKVTSSIPMLRDFAQAENDIVVATDNLEDAERTYAVHHAEREAEIAKNREIAADAENHTFDERMKALEEAQEAEEEDVKEQKKIAGERMRIAVEEAKTRLGVKRLTKQEWEKLTDDEKDKIVELYTTWKNLDSELSRFTRKNIKERRALTKEQESEQRQQAQTAKERVEKEIEIRRALEDIYINSITVMEERAYAIAKAAGERKIEDLKKRLATEKNLTTEAKRSLNELIILSEADLQLQLGKLREEFDKKILKDINTRRKGINDLWLSFLKDDEMIKERRIQAAEWERDELLTNAQEYVESAKKTYEQAQKDFEKAIEDGSYDELVTKYSGVFDLYGIKTGDTLKDMEVLVNTYHEQMKKAYKDFGAYRVAVINATEAEISGIEDTYTKNRHDKELKKIDTSRKHAEILRQIELEGMYDPYNNNELERTKLMQKQAEERVRIAKEENERIKNERSKYTDQELKAIYGSLEDYDNAVEESNLKVMQSENDLKDSVKAVNDEIVKQKVGMIENSIAIMSSIESITGSMQSLFETMAEDNESYADFATGMALMQILVSTAISIANAIEGATAAGAATGLAAPLTTPAFIAEMVGIVMSSMISATTTLLRAQQAKKSSPKFAEGGLIGGGYAATREEGRRDDVVIRASKGEYVINADSVKRYGVGFLDSINGRKSLGMKTRFADGGYISQITASTDNAQLQMVMMGDNLLASIAEIHPVVSVREITAAQNKIEMAEKISTR